jgi:DMSO/TMAO reductase YedYZ molybdopterin-dependent catalytic subunit
MSISLRAVEPPTAGRPTSPPPPPRRWRGAVAGIATAGLALGVAEVVAAPLRVSSPVVSVGNRVVDGAPVWVKSRAIDVFGTKDKPALIVGTLVLLGLFAALVGLAAHRRRVLGPIGTAAFAVTGAAAAMADAGAPWFAAAPALGGGLAAAAALDRLLHRRGPRPAGAVEPPSRDRRRFLGGLGATVAVAAVAGGVGTAVRRRLSVAAARAAIVLPRPSRPAAATPASAQVATPGVTPFITANDAFYRIDTALTVPQVDPGSWRLRITGMVDRELSFSLAELLRRPLVERVLTLVCVSNEVGGTLAGTARWLGVPLAELLAEAGVQGGADQLVSRSVDGYTAGTPTAAVLDGRDALLALGMNGEPLPTAHGFPARLIVPGLYGYVSATKWVTELRLTRFADFDAYWVPRGYAQQAPVKTFSRIDTPRGLAKVPAGPTAVAGVAWATHRGVSRVEVKVDDGPWHEATLAPAGDADTWRQWVYQWDATPGRHALTCRATDAGGELQTEQRTAPLPDGATGWHQIVALVE